VAGYARGILERDAQALLAAADVLHSSSRPLLYAASSAAPFPAYGENPCPQCVRQAGHQLPRPTDAADPRA
jgi:hypothetical protein